MFTKRRELSYGDTEISETDLNVGITYVFPVYRFTGTAPDRVVQDISKTNCVCWRMRKSVVSTPVPRQ